MTMDNFKHRSILIIDDEDAYRENLRNLFKRYFADVYEADNGNTAYQSYQEHAPDIIITDISMPKLDGMSLIKKIRSRDHSTKIIVTSGHPDQDYLLDAIPLQITKFLVKPFEVTDLMDAITESFKMENGEEGVIAFMHYCEEENLGLPCRLDRENHTITCGDNTYALSIKEYRLVDSLIHNSNRVLSYEAIEERVWEGEYMSSNALRTLIKKVRQKTCKDFIKNVTSFGYKVEIIPQESSREEYPR